MKSKKGQITTIFFIVGGLIAAVIVFYLLKALFSALIGLLSILLVIGIIVGGIWLILKMFGKNPIQINRAPKCENGGTCQK